MPTTKCKIQFSKVLQSLCTAKSKNESNTFTYTFSRNHCFSSSFKSRFQEVFLVSYFKNISVGIQFNGKQYCQKQVHFIIKKLIKLKHYFLTIYSDLHSKVHPTHPLRYAIEISFNLKNLSCSSSYICQTSGIPTKTIKLNSDHLTFYLQTLIIVLIKANFQMNYDALILPQ